MVHRIRTVGELAKRVCGRANTWRFTIWLDATIPRCGTADLRGWLDKHWLALTIVVAIGVLAPMLYSTAAPGNFDERLRTLTAIGTGIGALALFINLYFTGQTVENSRASLLHERERQQDERFFKAAELLGNERSIDARIAALFALEQLATDSDDH